MPVHYFNPPARVDEFELALTEFVAGLEAAGEEIVGSQPYGTLTAIFTRKTSTGTLTYVSDGAKIAKSSAFIVGDAGPEMVVPPAKPKKGGAR